MNIISSRLSRMAVAAAAVMALPLWVGCSDLEDDDHYANISTEIRNPELKIVAQTSEDYIKSQPALSQMYDLLNSADIFAELRAKDQLATILMVENSDLTLPVSKAVDDEALDFLIRSHISDVSISPANLRDGDRLMMWHGKYVNISMDEEGRNGQIVGHVNFNNGVVKEVIQTSNGYIYVISEVIQTPTSLSDYINDLPDEYSIFRDLVLSSRTREFLKDQSKPIGVSDDGNTLYDSVFRYSYQHFENVGVDLNSESLTATMLLPSNDVINAALNEAHSRLAMWEMERPDSIIKAWIRDVCFFNKRYTPADLSVPAALADPDNLDVNSVFSKQWRKTAQLIADEAEELSNGVVYKISKLYIPTNVLIYRLKDWFYHYEVCNDVQKASYFKMSNMKFQKCDVGVAAWTPLPGVWPEHECRALILEPQDPNETKEQPFTLDFTPIKPVMDNAGNSVIRPYLIPPGSYRLAFGSKQNQNININVSVLVGGEVVAQSEGEIILGSSTTYHYDRGTSLSDRYPEGFDSAYVQEVGGDKKAGNYDTDGGLLINEVTIPDVNGDGSGVPVVIRIQANNWYQQSSFTLNHWCLRPTVNCY